MNFYDKPASRENYDVTRTRSTLRRPHEETKPDDHTSHRTPDMSTRQDRTPERTAPDPDDPTTLSDRGNGDLPPTDDSWTDHCQCQFGTTDTTRLANLADDGNEAMPDGV